MSIPVVRFTVAGQGEATTGLGRPYTVVFDGDCKVCTRLSKVLRQWAGDQIEVVSSQQPGVMARFPWIPARAYADHPRMPKLRHPTLKHRTCRYLRDLAMRRLGHFHVQNDPA